MKDDFMENMPEGMVFKAAEVSASAVTEDDLRKINKLTLAPLTADDVFVFKAVLGDNETDDRNFEPFSLNALKDLKKLYIGKTVIKDHMRRADNQVARIYDTELISEAKTTGAGEAYAQLIAKCYMVKTSRNADLIKEIQGGIKKEVSTGMSPKRAICNICGTDNAKTYCPHWPGREYDHADGKKTCLITLDGAKDAFELSLVAVPAQRRAGVSKHYGGESVKEVEKPESEKQVDEQTAEHADNMKDAELRLRATESFLFAHNNESEEE